MVNPHGDPPTRFPMSSSPHAKAVFDHPSYGPTFGDGNPDVIVWSGNSSNPALPYSVASFTNFPQTYVDESRRGRGFTTFTAVCAVLCVLLYFLVDFVCVCVC